MADLIVTIIPVSITHNGDGLRVFGEIQFDTGDYAAGGVQAVWNYDLDDLSAVLADMVFRKVSAVHATRPAFSAKAMCGGGAYALTALPVAGSALPKIAVTKASDGTEHSAGELAAILRSPAFPHTIELLYKTNI